MAGIDAARALHAVAALRALWTRLPHVPTPSEEALLRRFDRLAEAPDDATEADVEAVAAGWRRWWRAGATAPIRHMARRLPPAVIAADRRLGTYDVAAGAAEPDGA